MKDLLSDLRIVDLSMGWAGPLAARHLADMGAQVIKVEGCVRFDWWRSWEATQEWIDDNGAEKAVAYLYANRNKLDITLDLETERGRELLLQLVSQSDGLIENFSGGTLPKLGLTYEDLRQANKEIVMLSMPAFGSDGPWAEFRAYGSTIEHSSGLPHLNGRPDDPPTMQHVALGDSIAGLNGVSAMLTALIHKQRTGEGQFIDLNQAECLFPLGIHGILQQSVTGKGFQRYGNEHPDYAPHGVYPCIGEDNWILIQVFDEADWSHLKAIAGLKFGELKDRIKRRKALDKELSQWTSNQDKAQLMKTLQQANICASVLNNSSDLIEDPHLKARKYVQWLDREYVGTIPHPSAPYRSGADPIPIERPAPTLGQHNEKILKQLLNISNTEFDNLLTEGVIGTKPLLR